MFILICSCVISTMCVPNSEFQLVNPTTQVALFSICLGSCSSIRNITWKIYQGDNTTSSTVQWTFFNRSSHYQNIWLFGNNLFTPFLSHLLLIVLGSDTSNFTAINQFFLANHDIILWRFEVVYSFASETSSSALNFIINQHPLNGSCSIYPLSGSTITLFTISCSNWFDSDGIKGYSLHAITDYSSRMIIAFSSVSDFKVRLPAGNENTSLLDLVVTIRDTRDCITEFNLTSVIVTPDLSSISDLMNTFQNSTDSLSANPLVRLLSSGNQNTVAQVLTSLSQQFNRLNTQALNKAVLGE